MVLSEGAPVRERTEGDIACRAVVEVRSPEQLATIAGLRPLRHFLARRRIALRLPFVDSSRQQSAERRWNFWLGVCGCQAGALFLLGALVWQIGNRPGAQLPLLAAVLRAGALAVTAGIAGKAAAVLGARAIFTVEAGLFLRRVRRDSGEPRLLP
jgi:hypothetical protein